MAVGRVFVPNKTLVSSPKFPTGCFPLPNSQQTRTRALLSQAKMCALSDPLHSTPHHLSHITKYLEFQAMK
ncbi:hypothetical protein L3X38_017426 [Prunus dulcis]|uniref:Uncharacterized protein n=1 Tax=Prunus dulcis TaxID=3755 RepID=A0AAD4Z9S4_PRUDU|nr:hypothetical protein L3X38_017426 [Prunus dulcis]